MKKVHFCRIDWGFEKIKKTKKFDINFAFFRKCITGYFKEQNDLLQFPLPKDDVYILRQGTYQKKTNCFLDLIFKKMKYIKMS